ncbi:MAG TPA: MBL fold metallo-hydrolase [Thermoleophilaceae bacterium]|jgi:L-ascorbate metabolism protein UlaG (beta-lactamase superfamily)
MQVEWYGQSAFRLSADGTTVFIDPFGDVSALASRGLEFNYPAIDGVDAHLLLVTHEHRDHNGVEAIGGDPVTLRSTAGRHESPIGEVIGVASEHDPAAGTQRGPNTIFVFDFDGVRVAHFGDFGQSELRDLQAETIGNVDLLFIPVGGGPTIDDGQAAAIAKRLGAKWIVPMHYRTPKVSFLETAEPFLERMPNVERLASPRFDTSGLPDETPLAIVPAAP